MIRLAVSVEGRTEVEFVKYVLAGHLRTTEVEPQPVLLGNARSGGGGGDVSVERLVSDMVNLDWSFDAVTSLVDFYGFRDKGDWTVEELEEHLAREIEARVSDARRMIPYVQKHEFEGLLFSDTAAFGAIGPAADQGIEALAAVRERFETPEDINDDPDTAPSRRIKRAIPAYDKTAHGPEVARATGLPTIRAQCPRFDAWMMRLERLARPV